MIVSHKYRFIFIRVHKTVVSSMEMAFGALCGPDDINWKKFGQCRGLPSFRDSPHRMPTDARLYFDEDQCLLDEVLDFQDLNTPFTALCSRLGIPYNGQMLREKMDVTAKAVDYHEDYDDETPVEVTEQFARENQNV